MPNNVYFVDGVAVEADYFYVISYLHEHDLESYEFSRVYQIDGGSWGNFETECQLVSADKADLNGVRSYFFLGRRGEVIIMNRNGRQEEAIVGPGTGADKLGYVTQIREIGGSLYACGANRQVYKRGAKAWNALHEQILDSNTEEVNSSFSSIHGTGAADIYAVGKRGEIYHYNGKKWKQCTSPTNVWLERVHCVSKDLVYICGNEGTFLRGSLDSWEVFNAPGLEEDFWGLTLFRGEPYVAYDTGILRFHHNELTPVKINLKPAPHFTRIYSVDDVLFTFGGHDIVRYDGKKWNRIICPDNA